jgi:hypothetical protein
MDHANEKPKRPIVKFMATYDHPSLIPSLSTSTASTQPPNGRAETILEVS